MLAEEYGYQVSDRRAAEFPGVMELLRSGRRKSLQRGAAGVAVLACVGVLWMFPGTHLFLFAGAFLLAPYVLTVLWVVITDAGWPGAAELMRLARQHPFQVWPCQAEEDSKRWNTKRLLLLAPDGKVAREFRTKMPDSVWHGMTDGRGVLWIAGDLRFNCLVATPGADSVWAARAIPPEAQPPRSSHLNAVEDELLRAATQEAFRYWLL
ncbi:hypothetical protein ACFW4X_14870 [Streptomyces smyrnaeus]|uniref:Uncharacterized protein n=1 Tax=Streptomyces smyrnaeus TaxID=1387713 RepID=A0ABS3XZR2_9ACTN|nr:hypothetical protein [Streptomyces smyrnaeus]MBO8200829.1 hypothetical protein [Streptomyces smyrnaeus]